MKRCILFFTALCLLFALSSPALASKGSKPIEASYQGIAITLDGREIIPVDAEGRSVEPFIYNGTTYLPVRGVANALHLDVTWDATKNLITLTSGGTTVVPVEPAKATWATLKQTITYRDISIVINGTKLTPKDAAGNPTEPFLIAGTTYLPVRAISEALNLTVSWDGANKVVALTSASTGSQDTPPAQTQTPGASSDPVKTSGTYVGSVDSDKYHSPECRYAKKILPENEIWFDTKAEASAKGYSPCGVCKP